MIRFLNSQPPITAADLDEVEQRYGFKFPEDFRSLYLKFNGGRPERDRFTDAEGTCIVHDFLPIKFGNSALSTLERSIQLIKVERSLLPDYLVQFAVDPGGDYYCFSTRGEDAGSIFLFHMEHYNNPRRATEYLAASLSEFLNNLGAPTG